MQNESVQNEVLLRLKNVKGHIAGIERMVEEHQACSNVMIQLSAIRSSIEKIGIYILENNAIECLCNELDQKPEDKQKVEQIVKQMISFLK
ncbi:metal-sensitive transcriptional repressor [Lucifera butyrica]|uniref:Metal-sensitive transcriptional repressor n=2 Tax=Lucifera butyrica TaxID=1351585 RepID=A0A498R9H7_9FIRM|nr:metal-sensitive transcriptional repressor [Lucifera butyrica]